jgi:hypothetical protein
MVISVSIADSAKNVTTLHTYFVQAMISENPSRAKIYSYGSMERNLWKLQLEMRMTKFSL